MKVVKFMIKQLFMHLKADLPRQDIQVEIDFLESILIGQILPTQTGSSEGRFLLNRSLEGSNSTT